MISTQNYKVGDKKIRYLMTGALNTAFGSAMMIFMYTVLGEVMHIFLIGLIANVINISFSFLTNKLFVFKTQGRWMVEWARSFAVYGFSAVITILLNWIFVDIFAINIYATQLILIPIAIVISYFGNVFFTFSTKVGHDK